MQILSHHQVQLQCTRWHHRNLRRGLGALRLLKEVELMLESCKILFAMLPCLSRDYYEMPALLVNKAFLLAYLSRELV